MDRTLMNEVVEVAEPGNIVNDSPETAASLKSSFGSREGSGDAPRGLKYIEPWAETDQKKRPDLAIHSNIKNIIMMTIIIIISIFHHHHRIIVAAFQFVGYRAIW
ncbi:hypothetical protein J7T55_012173 [Diaporthe amygdali]|uniref:uncharacterized protein n=1 Tax=Phomopsis amygdali TaxID=1214568 RepID=UPI0022FDBF09|nr:uncharacterized protein J7T55_012173 [Diaporthe amygdali]KAJ0123704.1 hypothetical protein J7T55_012173 [Diaporthe amygdali]